MFVLKVFVNAVHKSVDIGIAYEIFVKDNEIWEFAVEGIL